MRCLRLFFLILCVAGMAVFAQDDEFDVSHDSAPVRESGAPRSPSDGKPRVAFYFVGEEPREGVFRPLGGQITKAVVESGEYIAVDRTAALRTLLSSERDYQMSGAVDEDQMAALGKEWGVKYVISIEITKSIDAFYIEAKMVDVEGSYIAKMGHVETKFRSSVDVTAAAEKLVADLLGAPQKSSGRRAAAQKTEKEDGDSKPAVKKMRYGLRLAPTFRILSEKEMILWEYADPPWGETSPYSLLGDGLGVDVGLVMSYSLLNRLHLNAEANYSYSNFQLTEKRVPNIHWYEHGTESGLSVPITLQYVFNEPKPYSIYAEIGVQMDITFSNSYIDPAGPTMFWNDYDLEDQYYDWKIREYIWRASAEVGVVVGAGLTFNMWKLTSYAGYRAVIGLTPFDKWDDSHALIRHSFGISILY